MSKDGTKSRKFSKRLPLKPLKVKMVEIAANRELIKFGEIRNVSRALGVRRWVK